VSLIKKSYPVNEEFLTIFPSLLSKEMPYIELHLDEEGEVLRSEKPVNVKLLMTNYSDYRLQSC
jgi:hypothetical protein